MAPGPALQQQRELASLLRESADLRRVSVELAKDVERLRAEIAKNREGRIVGRLKEPRLKGK